MRSPDRRWDRIGEVVDQERLADVHVVVVGVGSGGSTVAVELAKAGVGRLTLVDPDRLELANVLRHEADDRSVGRNKAEAVADLVARRNPRARVVACPEDVFALRDRLPALVSDAELVAVCTDAEPPKRLLTREALAARVPAVFAGVYPRGVGGEVIVCEGGASDPCYACVVSAIKDPVAAGIDHSLDYGAIGPDGVARGVPGLGMDVRLIALLHARVSLEILVAGERALPGNVLLFGTTSVPGLFPRPFASAWVRVARRADCLLCGPLRGGAL